MSTRLERVVVEMDDRLSTPAVGMAAKVALLTKGLDDIDGSGTRASKSIDGVGASSDRAGTALRKGGADIDAFSGRLKLLVQSGLLIGPAIVPAVAGLVPAVTGLASGMAGAAGAAAAAGLAFAGVGDALGALNEFQLEPSAENFLALQQAMDELGPAGENFVRYLSSLGDELESLQQIAGANMFPGMTSGLQSLMGLLPEVQVLIGDLSARMGDLAADAGAALAGPQWESFFSFLQTDAAPIFEQFARASGNVALGLGNLMVAFAPLSRDFASGMLEASQAFASWSADTSNFEDFIGYVQAVGPQVADFLGSLAEAAVALAEAVAPWGSMVLPAMTAVLDVFTAIAGSPIGPALTTAALAMLAFNKAAAAGSMIMGRVAPAAGSMRSSLGQMKADIGTVATTWATAGAATERESKKMAAASGRLKASMAGIGKGAALVGAVGVASSGAADGIGLQNTAMLGLAGTMAGPWGAAAGAGIGLILDYKAAQSQAAEASKAFADTLDQQTGKLTENSAAWIQDQISTDQLASLQKAGVNIEEVTDAVSHGKDAWMDYFDSLSPEKQDAILNTKAGFFDGNLNNKLIKMGDAADGGASRFDALKGSTDGFTQSAATAVTTLNELTAAQQASTEAALAGLNAGAAYGAALDRATEQAEGAEQGFNKFTEAGRNNITAMTGLVSAYNAQDAATKNSVKGYRDARAELAEVGKGMGLTAERIEYLQGKLEKPAILRVDSREAQAAIRGARSAFQSLPGEVMTHIMTNGVPRTNAQIDALVKKYKLTEEQRTALVTLRDAASAGLGNIINLIHNVKGKTVTVGVNTGSAVSNVRAVQAVINGLSGKTVTITTLQRTVYAAGKMDSIAKAQGKADGGEILGQRQPYGDKVLIWAAPGEEVISNRNGQADAFRRDRAAGRIPAYAEGGTITLPGYANGGTIRGASTGTKSLEAALERHGKRLERALGKAEKAVDRAKNTVDKWNDRRDQLKTAVRSSLTRDWMGDGNQDVWAAGAQEGTAAFAREQWKGQAADAKQLTALIANLRKNGAGDAFIAEILQSDDPLTAAKAFNSESKKSLMHTQKLFTDATRYTNAAANSTSSIYADEQRKANIELRSLNNKVASLEKAINQNHKAAERTRERTSAAKSAAKGSRARKR
ncbi:MAG TPA: hypothetical protein VIP58_10340 [Nocardioides sp.]